MRLTQSSLSGVKTIKSKTVKQLGTDSLFHTMDPSTRGSHASLIYLDFFKEVSNKTIKKCVLGIELHICALGDIWCFLLACLFVCF